MLAQFMSTGVALVYDPRSDGAQWWELVLPDELTVVSAGDPRCCAPKREPTLQEFSACSLFILGNILGGGYDML